MPISAKYIKFFRFGMIFLCIIPIILCGGFFASAEVVNIAQKDISIILPDEYIILTKNNAANYSGLLEGFGVDVENFGNNLKKSGTLIFAVTEDGKYQVNLKEIDSDISAEIYDLTMLTAENRESVKTEIISGLSETGNMTVLESREAEVSGTLFYRVLVRVSTGTGEFCFVQYFSIWNGKYYGLVFYNSDPEISESELSAAQEIFDSLKIERKLKSGTLSAVLVLQIILIAVLIGAGLFFTGYIIFSLIRDFRIARAEKENRINQIRRR